MHCPRLLRRGALCALLLLVARLLSSSLFDTDPDMMQYFRAVCGRSTALDNDPDAFPVLASVHSPVMSANDAPAPDSRSAAATLAITRQMTTFADNISATQTVLTEAVTLQSSQGSDTVALKETVSAVVGAVGNLATQVSSLTASVIVTDNAVNTTATAQNAVDAMQALPNMHNIVTAVVALEKRSAAALEYSNRPQLIAFDGAKRN